MSEFLAEARVIIRPDTTKFRAELQTEITRAVTGLRVPPVRVPVVAGAGRATDLAATNALVDAERRRALEMAAGANATKAASKAAADHARNLESVRTAAFASAAGLTGLRGAVLTAGGAFLGATVAIQATLKALQEFARFESEIAVFGATTGATAEEMERVSEAARRLGADVRLPAVSAADAAVAMSALAKAGLDVENAIAGAEGVLQLSTAAQIDQAAAAVLAANALNAFGLAGTEATAVADAFANAANASQGSIEDMGIALRQAAAVANQVGLSLQDTTTLLSLFAKNGLTGSDAGTSLRVALIRLIAPTKKAAAEIQRLGLDIRDAQGNVRPDIFAQFGEATERLGPAARDASAALIFGQDAIRAVAIGAREGEKGLRIMRFEIDQQGTAAELAAARTSGLSGSIEALRSSLSTLGTSLGEVVAGPLQNFLGGLADMATLTGSAIEGLKDLKDQLEDTFPGGGAIGEGIGFALEKLATPVPVSLARTAEDFGLIGDEADETAKKIKLLTERLDEVQKARIAAERGGEPQVADALSRGIVNIRAEIERLKDSGAGIPKNFTDHLIEARDMLLTVKGIRIDLGIPTAGVQHLIDELDRAIPISQHVEGNFNRLQDDFGRTGDEAETAAEKIKTLAQALAGLNREAARAQAELLRLQTEGGTPGQQIAVLQADIQTQRDIIAAAKARGGKGAATAIENARKQILSDQAQIDSIVAEQASAARQAKGEAEKVQADKDDALLALLTTRREDLSNAAAALIAEGNIKGAIALLDRQQALIAQQIIKIRRSVQDEEKKAAAIRELRQAKNKSEREEEKLRAQILQEQQERAATIQQLNIDIALERGNEAAAKRAIQARIKTIDAQIKAAKGDQLRIKQLILEKVRLQNQLKELEEVEDENRESARERAAGFFFEQMQAQQGFAANLLGNLITGSTAGLVGVPAPSTTGGPGEGLSQRINAEAAAATGRAGMGPTAGQTNAEIGVLNRILEELKRLNGSYDSPEAIHQKKVASGSMDNFAM